MAVCQLTEKIWWSNMHGPVEAKGLYKSILDMSGDYIGDGQHYRLSQIEPRTMVFRLWANEDVAPDNALLQGLENIRSALNGFQAFPLLVHCYAGQCRAPATAVFMAWLENQTKTYLDNLRARMKELAPLNGGVDERRLYHRLLQEHMTANSKD